MKKLFLTIVTFSILFVVGCQKNSITDPVTVEPTSKVQQTDPSHQGSITLDRMLTDPYPVMNSYFILNGEIEYDYRLDVIKSVPAVQQYSVSLNLTISAGLTYLCTVCEPQTSDLSAGTISNESNDEISISIWEDEIILLEKSYLIQGREDGMVIMFRFFVTTKDIRLTEVFLVLPEIES